MSVQQYSVESCQSTPVSVERGLLVLDVPGLQHAARLGAGVRVNHHGLGQINLVVTQEHMFRKSRGWKVSVCQGLAVFPKANIQGSACLADIGAGHWAQGMLYTTPFLRFAGTGSFSCTSSCCRVLKERKLTCIARGDNTLRMDSDSLPK